MLRPVAYGIRVKSVSLNSIKILFEPMLSVVFFSLSSSFPIIKAMFRFTDSVSFIGIINRQVVLVCEPDYHSKGS